MLPFDTADTIAAIASPPGPAPRGIVRLTGPDAWRVATNGFESPGAVQPIRPCRRTGSIRIPGLRAPLPAAFFFWPGPRTYTGQDAAEIHTVGSPPLLQRLLAHCLETGARLAEPGEFTLRAFLSGRIDLTRAEAVLGVIEARNPAQLQAALGQLAGGLAGPIATLRDRLLDILAHLEANLDFVDEADVLLLGREALAAELADGARALSLLAEQLGSRDRPSGHPLVVLAGPPNAGKSRLFNALLGREHALVSPVAGTTRDYLSALIDCDGLTVELVDTAGEETPLTAIDERAQSLRSGLIDRADLLLACTPADDMNESGATSGAGLKVLTKCDLEGTCLSVDVTVVATSAATGLGLDALRESIARAIRSADSAADLATTTGARCRESFTRAAESLTLASLTLTRPSTEELVAIDLRQAVDELGKVIGAVVTDDILDRIFRRFCIGK